MAQKNSPKGRTVLITRFSAVGDIAMTIPLLYSLCEQYPTDRFILVSRERFGQFLINNPKNLQFIGVNLGEYKGIAGLYRLYRRLKKENPDYIADLHDVLRTKILRWFFLLFGGTKCAHIDKGRKDKKALTSGSGRKEQLKSTFIRYQEVLEKLGFTFRPKFRTLFKEEAGDIEEFSSFIPAKGGDKWVGIAPFAKHRGKIFPTEKMEKVVELLTAHNGIKLFFFGNGEEEERIVNEWCTRHPNCISFIGKTNFNGELRFISHLDTMVCMDSANMHIASLAGVPAISIWGATSPLAGFLGWNQERENCIELNLDCRPCSIFGNKPCRFGDYRCMDIPPERITKKIIETIKL